MNIIRHLKNFSLRLFAAAFVIFLTACSPSGFEVENYMRPPAATGESAAMQQLLQEHLGTEYTLRYPRSGEHRSAVVIANLDSDSATEAVVFYRLSTESTGAHMVVLDCSDSGKWSIAGESTGGGDIDQVLFGDINGDGINEIITGWKGSSDGCITNVHTLSGGVLHPIGIITGEQDRHPANQYSEMAVGDFDGDLRDEIMTVFRSAPDGTAVARMLHLGYGVDGSAQLRTAASIPTDGSVYEYLNAQAGYVGMGTYCMVLDGCRGDGQYVTEIIMWDSETQTLAAPLCRADETVTASFSRSCPTISRDINDDGMIELPRDKLLPGYSRRLENPMYLTSWYNLSDNELQLASQAVMQLDQGYYFQFAIGWDGTVTAQPDINPEIMYFYLAGEEPFAAELFRIKIFTLDEWAERRDSLADTLLSQEEPPDYQQLAVTDYYVYAALLSPHAQELGITPEQIAELFRLAS